MLRSSPPLKTADMQVFRGIRCRGEDSNLCCIARLYLPVGHPLRSRDGFSQLAIAGLLGSIAILVPSLLLYGAALWVDVIAWRWCVAQLKPRNGGAPLTTGDEVCDSP